MFEYVKHLFKGIYLSYTEPNLRENQAAQVEMALKGLGPSMKCTCCFNTDFKMQHEKDNTNFIIQATCQKCGKISRFDGFIAIASERLEFQAKCQQFKETNWKQRAEPPEHQPLKYLSERDSEMKDQKWISVHEQLPPPNEPVFIFWRDRYVVIGWREAYAYQENDSSPEEYWYSPEFEKSRWAKWWMPISYPEKPNQSGMCLKY